MLPTPSTTHINPSLIYPPAEDSYLLLDTLSSASETHFLHSRFHPSKPSPTTQKFPNPSPNHHTTTAPLIAEIGTGSGIILAFLTAHAATLFGRSDILTLGLDINAEACKAARKTVVQACKDVRGVGDGYAGGEGGFLGCVNGDLCCGLREGEVDMLVFNPPYVPTPSVPGLPDPGTAGSRSEEYEEPAEPEDLLSLSYAGGVDGMEVTNRLLAQLPAVLNPERGVAYVLLCKQNRPDEVVERVRGWGGEWRVNVVGRSGRFGGWEKLVVVRVCRGDEVV
ncbi:MAG: hypothetical protein LQ352_008409 [Teloschistes flavicans]|nr:MAG: hypothetical protein LQ352_008409 [Teloschistes flavicans]